MRFCRMVVCAAVATLGVGCQWLDDRPAPVQSAPYSANAQGRAAVFTSARPSFGAALSDYLWVQKEPTQPLEFPHDIHIQKAKLACTEACHEAVTRGPVAGLPSVNTCMTCHSVIAADKERIKVITEMSDKGQDLAWQRVYKFAEPAHVKFNHAPHIRNNVECSTCHGDIAHQTVAKRNVTLGMGFCVSCHREKHAPNDCLTCHY